MEVRNERRKAGQPKRKSVLERTNRAKERKAKSKGNQYIYAEHADHD
jgi:hypothetical protein